ncbi:LytR/AlgR family response regulator transcription factor [Silvibacterium dinghuense]|uniref:Response regulator transcription factor n=1 Tax=Silvibacterium dinghuense TaxID=1560006 RepID=A0A4Q1SGZ7_9BACT|nr:LytTR family DNA-binding domain-containing protein [Silvibacterium dinghuense]RXS96818.1 response regulator transcription factor [Silvibacterium dinghuense]GGG93890.1 DNA-binding response regulator [Silvibacterium dinghuense]
MKLKALIADDEALARERLRLLLAGDHDFVVAGECRNGREVVTALKEDRFDVLFLDIEMPGGNGFEAIAQTGPAQMPCTIFVTAHHHYALQAFEVHALDYLTKPIEPGRLKSTLARVKNRVASQAALLTHEELQMALQALRDGTTAKQDYPTRLVIPDGKRDAVIQVQEIEWIEAADYYSCLHVGTRTLMLRETMKQLSETLDPKQFVRVHRSTIVNIAHVREILHGGRNEGWVCLTSGQRLRMSKAGWQNLLAASRV